MSRQGRALPAKSEEQQATLMLHKTRELLVKQNTISVNALRSHLAESHYRRQRHWPRRRADGRSLGSQRDGRRARGAACFAILRHIQPGFYKFEFGKRDER
jgi:transposase